MSIPIGRWTTMRLILFLSFVSGEAAFSLEIASNTQLSDNGSDRATRYVTSNKVVTYSGRTHVAWLDWLSDTVDGVAP